MCSEKTPPEFSPGEVQELTGLSSRQQNDWDNRGALPHVREADEGWRRYTPRQVFVLMVCSELRKKTGVSVERLKFIQDFMLQEEADHLASAIQLMGLLGMGVWLLTDFEKTFIMDSELEFDSLWNMGFFGGDSEQTYVLLKVNPIVNRLLACRKEPVHLEAHGRGRELMHLTVGSNTPEEDEVLELIRSGDFEKVEVMVPNGVIETIKTTSRPDVTSRLESLLENHEYQTMHVHRRNGKVVSLQQEVTIKPRSSKRAQ
jgi:DNA-binding transcriptional MerR regulator